jgi:hypothetical protein
MDYVHPGSRAARAAETGDINMKALEGDEALATEHENTKP